MRALKIHVFSKFWDVPWQVWIANQVNHRSLGCRICAPRSSDHQQWHSPPIFVALGLYRAVSVSPLKKRDKDDKDPTCSLGADVNLGTLGLDLPLELKYHQWRKRPSGMLQIPGQKAQFSDFRLLPRLTIVWLAWTGGHHVFARVTLSPDGELMTLNKVTCHQRGCTTLRTWYTQGSMKKNVSWENCGVQKLWKECYQRKMQHYTTVKNKLKSSYCCQFHLKDGSYASLISPFLVTKSPLIL